ncbi:MAG: hypothetical protein CVU50_03785 [Candidatus Cloacimonetes bacterium HGW-Cloacimonetes-3]|jgi:hypothetical protein|nr:MAG: hypothetical protein CVU50_03785 [Candidatus Cloacimonetes bacterium HGW-Cloacimonetes-3]
MKQEYIPTPYYREFRQLMAEFQRFKALGYIDEIWCHPGTGISATHLYNLHNNVQAAAMDTDYHSFYCPDGNTIYYYPPELPIAICDAQTLSQVKAAVSALSTKLHEARYNNDLACVEDCEQQLAKYHDYLKDCITSHKRIRYISNLDHDLSLLIYRSVQALYKALQPKHPELVNYLKQHVVIGVKCYWSESPVKDKPKPKTT